MPPSETIAPTLDENKLREAKAKIIPINSNEFESLDNKRPDGEAQLYKYKTSADTFAYIIASSHFRPGRDRAACDDGGQP